MFELEVKDVYNFGNVSIIVGKANKPLFNGKIKCGDKTYEVKSLIDNTHEASDKLSFQVWGDKADKSIIGKTFKSVA